MEEFDVGNRLRTLRSAQGFTQRQLADAAGVPHGQISMIETNRSSPSVASLRKILGGLGLGMAEFFEPESPERKAVFFRADDLTDLTSRLFQSNGSMITLKQVGNARAHGLQILHETYGPGADTGETMLAHEASEGGIVVSGEIEVTVGAEHRLLCAGDAYLFDSHTPHRFRNVGEQPAVVISACTPPYL